VARIGLADGGNNGGFGGDRRYVYWIAVVTNDNDKPNSISQRPDTQLSTRSEEQGQRNPAQEPPAPPQRREEILEAYQTALAKNLETLRVQNLEAQNKTYEVLRRRVALIMRESESRTWKTNFDDLIFRNWVVSAPHQGDLSSLKSHRRAFTARTLARIAAGEEETSGKVVVTVGSVKIEIQEDEPTKTTNVHITSPKTAVVTNVGDTTAESSQQNPREFGQQRPTTTIH
jgi:hypothetical protein